MTDMSYMPPEELQAVFGKQIQELRISKNLDQITTAEKAGVSTRALRNLETGRGSSRYAVPGSVSRRQPEVPPAAYKTCLS
jgi:DNA-binding XRE family transcriptional regulator